MFLGWLKLWEANTHHWCNHLQRYLADTFCVIFFLLEQFTAFYCALCYYCGKWNWCLRVNSYFPTAAFWDRCKPAYCKSSFAQVYIIFRNHQLGKEVLMAHLHEQTYKVCSFILLYHLLGHLLIFIYILIYLEKIIWSCLCN